MTQTTVLQANQTELRISSIVEDLDSLNPPAPGSDWGKYTGELQAPWKNATEIESKKDSENFNFQTDVLNNITGSYSSDRYSSMIKIAETEAKIPGKSVFIPLSADCQGYYFAEEANTLGIANKTLEEEGINCNDTINSYSMYFDECGVNTSYLGYQPEKFIRITDSSVSSGICLPEKEEIMGPRGEWGHQYKVYPANRILYNSKNTKIFKTTTVSGAKTPQPYQLSFFAQADKPCDIRVAVTRTPGSATAGSTSDLLYTGKVRYLNNDTLTSCPITSKWGFYWVNLSLPLSLSSLTESDFYFHIWCVGSSSPILLNISDVRLEKTEELCGNKPNYYFTSTYVPLYQQLQLNLSKPAAPTYTANDYPELIMFRINKYSKYNKIRLVLQGTITNEIPSSEGWDIFQYDENAPDVENNKCIVLLQRTNATNTYKVYSITNKSLKYTYLGTVTLASGSKLTIGATDPSMKYTSIGIESVIACYDSEIWEKEDFINKSLYLCLSNGDLTLPKTKDTDWSTLETDTLNNAWIISNPNVEETDI